MTRDTNPRAWCACHKYAHGAVVMHDGAAWRATVVTKGEEPGVAGLWERLPTVVLTPKHDMAASHDARIGRGL